MDMEEGEAGVEYWVANAVESFLFSPAWKWRWINVHAEDDICYFLQVNL